MSAMPRPPTTPPAALRALRERTGLSQREAEESVRIIDQGGRRWRRWENGEATPDEGLVELFCIRHGLEYPPGAD